MAFFFLSCLLSLLLSRRLSFLRNSSSSSSGCCSRRCAANPFTSWFSYSFFLLFPLAARGGSGSALGASCSQGVAARARAPGGALRRAQRVMAPAPTPTPPRVQPGARHGRTAHRDDGREEEEEGEGRETGQAEREAGSGTGAEGRNADPGGGRS